MNIHYTTAIPAVASSPVTPRQLSQVQQANFATAFLLAHGPDVAQQILRGRILEEALIFAEYDWLVLGKRTTKLFHSLLHQGIGSRDRETCHAAFICFIPFFIRASAHAGGSQILLQKQTIAKGHSIKEYRRGVDAKSPAFVALSFRLGAVARA